MSQKITAPALNSEDVIDVYAIFGLWGNFKEGPNI